VTLGEQRVVLTGYGTVAATTAAAVRAQVGGEIVAVHQRLDVGTHVAADDVLFEIDPRDYELRRAVNAQTGVRLAAEIAQLREEHKQTERLLALRQEAAGLSEAEYNRARALAEKEIGTASEVDQMRRVMISDAEMVVNLDKTLTVIPHRIAALEAEIGRIEKQLAVDDLAISRCTVRSPFAGRITAVMVERGDVVQPGTVAVRLVDDSEREIAVAIDGADVQRWLPFSEDADDRGWFRRPQRVPAAVHWVEGGSDLSWPALVDRIAAYDAQSRMCTVVVRIAERAAGATAAVLVDGMFCEVRIASLPVADAVRLPRAAVQPDGSVFVEVDGRLVSRQVHVLRVLGDEILIDQGLATGDRVVLNRIANAVAGMQVKRYEAPTDLSPAEAADTP
jgi:multidrug efflux pump subunit AcrA (membrane-fusion protein)